MREKHITSSTEAERAAEEEKRNQKRLALYKIKREVDEIKKEVNERTRLAYLERMSKNPSFLKVQAD